MSESEHVAIIDPLESSRAMIGRLLSSIEIQSRAYGNAHDFLAENTESDACGCVITDTLLPGMSGLELQHRLARWPVPPPVIVVTARGDVPTAVEALRAGAIDFLEKPPRPQVLLDRVYEAFERFRRSREVHALKTLLQRRHARLTPREREVMDLVSVGYPNKAVAQRLGVTRKAVEAYRARVMRKMEADSLPTLVRECVVLTGDARPIDTTDQATRRPATYGGAASHSPTDESLAPSVG